MNAVGKDDRHFFIGSLTTGFCVVEQIDLILIPNAVAHQYLLREHQQPNYVNAVECALARAVYRGTTASDLFPCLAVN